MGTGRGNEDQQKSSGVSRGNTEERPGKEASNDDQRLEYSRMC